MFGLDFSYARPGGATLAANGVSSVGRYLGTDGRCIALPELDDYLANGVSVWFIKEGAANGMLNGYRQGVTDAQSAQTALDTLGQPNAAVYFTADFDAQPVQFPALDSYLAGVATIIPVTRIGIYAGIDYMNHAEHYVTFRWKTASSAFDHGQTTTVTLHLIQTLAAVPIPNTDYDNILQAGHGQVGGLGTATVTTGTDPVKAIQTALNAHGYNLAVDGIDGPLTDAAIRQYQIEHGLAVIRQYQIEPGLAVGGLVDAQTWASLNGNADVPPAYPLPNGYYFGPESGPVNSISGHYSYSSDLKEWQTRMVTRGWTITADGLYGPQTASVTRTFQQQKGLTVDSLIGPQTWAAAWTAPIS